MQTWGLKASATNSSADTPSCAIPKQCKNQLKMNATEGAKTHLTRSLQTL